MKSKTKNINQNSSFSFFQNAIFVYSIGNDFGGINIKSNGIIDRVKKQNYPFSVENDVYLLKSPDGYKIYVTDGKSNADPFESVIINSNDLQKTKTYWTDLLNLKLVAQSDHELTLKYGGEQAKLIFQKTGNKIIL